jgi:hypothetical protein
MGEPGTLTLALTPGSVVACLLCRLARRGGLGRCRSKHGRPVHTLRSLGLLMATAGSGWGRRW